MNKKIISIVLSISLLSSPLTVLADGNGFNIHFIEECNTSFAYAVTDNGINTLIGDNVLELPADTSISLDESDNILALENAKVKTDGFLVGNNRVEVGEKRSYTKEEINAEFGESDGEDDERTEKNMEPVGEIRVKAPITAQSARSSATASDSANRLKNINSKDSFALQNQTGRTSFVGDNIGTEYVDPLTGNLIVTETDLVLPGVDGLNLRLERYYSLAEAEFFTKSSGIKSEPTTFIMPEGSYVVTESVWNTETGQISEYQYPYASEGEAELRKAEIESRDTCNGLYIYSADYRQCEEGEEILVDYYYTSDITSSSYVTMRSDLGSGWSWAFPSVQPIKDNYNDYNTFEMPKAIYYHDGKGGVTEVDCENPNDCYLINYVGRDITFEIVGDYDSDICSTSRIDYMVEDGDRTRYYFGTHGEIRSIIDVHGNKIEFGYKNKSFYGVGSKPVISYIKDTVGRTVSFNYTGNGDTEEIAVTVTSPFEPGETLNLKYTKKMVNFTQNGESLSSEPVLTSVENSEGEITSYYPARILGSRQYAYATEFAFGDKKLNSTYLLNTSGIQNNFVYLLGSIVRPHSNTYYEYGMTERNLGQSGVSEAYVIRERGDYELTVQNNIIRESYPKNTVSYRYVDDYTGYPFYYSISGIPEEERVCKFKETRSQSTKTLEYYKLDESVLLRNKVEKYINPIGSDLSISTEILSYLLKQPQTIKKVYSNDNNYSYESYMRNEIVANSTKAYGKPEIVSYETDYETAMESDRWEKYAESYTYDDVTGNVLSKSHYRNTSTKCTESYTYTADNRLSKVTGADGKETVYIYTTTPLGTVSKKTTVITNGDESFVTEENYSAVTGYAFPDSVVKTVTANGTTSSNTETFTYDMLKGVIASKTDNDGNTTYYEYDKLSRPVRIVYPRYSTYSGYNEKNIDILPVKNIRYVTVSKDDYVGIPDTSEKLIAQAVQTTTRYYDVSDIAVVNPNDAELADSSILYIGDEINYYMGTGELIQRKVLDNTEGVIGYDVTTYVYDTQNNITTTIDSEGNSTEIYGDGLGREVKSTDIFGNSRITEYNLSQENAGFKALSYFIPVSNSDAKENIVEYTYDRLQRVTAEKTGNSNEFSEIKYNYDIVGNVIGVTDANRNMNSQGCTTLYIYDKLNRVVKTINANDEVLENVYDIFGNIKIQTISDKNGNTSILYQREYDGAGNIITDTDNAGNSNTYSYNEFGELVQKIDKNGKQTDFEYNAMGANDRRSIIQSESSVADEQYAYYTPYGASVIMKAEADYDSESGDYSGGFSEIRNIEYSPNGHLLTDKSKYFTTTGVGGVYFYPEARYTYDSYGNILSSTFACIDDVNEKKWGVRNSYEYNKNRISAVSVPNGAKVRYEFYDDGKLKTVTYPTLNDGGILKSEYTYDGLSRLKTLVNKKNNIVLSSFEYTYDGNGNILTVEETVGGNTNNAAYTYDKLNRIISVTGSKGNDSYYEYDYRGNRKINFEQTDFLSEENAVYRYDLQEKMCYAQTGDNTTEIEYGTNGYRCIKRDNAENTDYYIYDQSSRLQAEAAIVRVVLDGSVKTVMHPSYQYVWGPDKVLAQFDILNNEIYYYLYNGHGDVVQIVDTNGNIVNSYDYDVWGNFITKNETIHNPFTYFGQTYDETTGLYYLRARYYDPATSRMLSEDPVKAGLNWYVYCNNNPVMFVDPSGLVSLIFVGYGMEAQADVRKKYYTNKYGTDSFEVPVDSAEKFVDKWNELINICNQSNILIDAIEIISHGSIDGDVGKDKYGTAYSTGYIYFTDSKNNKLYARNIIGMKKGDRSVASLLPVIANELNLEGCNTANKDTYNVVYGFMQKVSANSYSGFDGGAQWSEKYGDHIRGGGDFTNDVPFWAFGDPWYYVKVHQSTWWKYVNKNHNGNPVREREGRRYF